MDVILKRLRGEREVGNIRKRANGKRSLRREVVKSRAHTERWAFIGGENPSIVIGGKTDKMGKGNWVCNLM